MTRSLSLLALPLLPLVTAAAPHEDYAAPYRVLQQAHQSLDPAMAASAYASDGTLSFEYPGRPIESFRGTDAIRNSYVRSFGQIEPGNPITLEFRFDPPGLSWPEHKGAFRADVQAGGRDVTFYGRFSVKLVKEGGSWRFAEDHGMPATETDFDRLPVASLDRR